jgi:hypothetical protein
MAPTECLFTGLRRYGKERFEEECADGIAVHFSEWPDIAGVMCPTEGAGVFGN